MFWSVLAILGIAWAAPDIPSPIQTPSARVERNIVIYPGEPRLRVSVPSTAKYIGADRFILKELSDCEMHIFVDADANRRVRRFYWVHFESNLPSKPNDRMNYADIDRRAKFWGSTIWVRTRPSLMSRTPKPGSDTDHFRSIVRNAGYEMPPGMMTARLVRLLDDPKGTGYGRQELMLIYGEDLTVTGLTFDDLMTNGEPNSRWVTLEEPLLERAVKAFHVANR